jgi:hypothetical protein
MKPDKCWKFLSWRSEKKGGEDPKKLSILMDA